MKKYHVFGGQYERCWYGDTDNLQGAKILASKHMEYWDNWQGFHKPDIYEAKDVRVVESRNRITTNVGSLIHVLVDGAVPYLVWDGRKWVEYQR